MDKDIIDIVLETDLIAENEVCMIVAEVEETIKMAIIMVIEVIDPEMGDMSQILDIMIDPIIKREVLIKTMTEEIEIEV